jgi:alginate O-acetyltransferase complex protein AlgI
VGLPQAPSTIGLPRNQRLVLFSSNLFLFVFLPLALAVYALATLRGGRGRIANATLLVLSLAFYAWGSGWVVLVLTLSAIFNFALGRKIAPAALATRRWLLTAGILANMGVLLYFKYAAFAYENIGIITRVFDRSLPDGAVFPALPVGVSFYTFMATAYLIETYRGGAQAKSLIDFGLFLSLFPHLVAGPIVRFSEIKGDIESRTHTLNGFFDGMCRFCLGLGKKVLIANTLSIPADAIFALPADQLNVQNAWVGAVCYSFQIFFDFSGYTDMAIGLAKMLGFNFPENFAQPYRSSSVTEFWRKWHMTLTRWFRDYVYIPLGGNRHGRFATYANLFTVFFLCGLWHGAAWTFVLWGIYHGLLLVSERLLGDRSVLRRGILGVPLTFVLVTIGWVLFRSTSIDAAYHFLAAMAGLGNHYVAADTAGPTLRYYMTNSTVSFLIIAIVMAFWKQPHLASLPTVSERLTSLRPAVLLARGVVAIALLLLAVAYLSDATYNPFIYFRF